MYFGRNIKTLRKSARQETFPPPVGGLNARDPVPSVPITDALSLDNFIVEELGVVLRNGYDAHVTGIGNPIAALLPYVHPSDASKKLFAVADDSIYDVTTAGAVGAAVATGLDSPNVISCQFATAGSNYTYCVNGINNAFYYNGSSWVTPSITGVSSDTFAHVNAHMKRLFFVEKDSSSVWYLGTLSISGAATEIDFGPLMRRGGHMLCMCTITKDSGDGGDDLAAFITSEGEVFLYQGTDPDNANTWVLVGIYNIPKPVGRSCFTKIGADVAVITSAGVIPLSQVLGLSSSGQFQAAVTDKISRLIWNDYRDYGTLNGWQIEQYPTRQITIVNVPTEEGVSSRQYCVSTRTGMWSRWTDINTMCWCSFNSMFYFGGVDGTVYIYSNATYSDNGNPIEARIQTAYSRFNSPNQKLVNMVRPIVYSNENYEPSTTVLADYDTNIIDYSTNQLVTAGALWDEATWDVDLWAGSVGPVLRWTDGHQIGSAISVAMSVTVEEEFRVNGIDVIYEEGQEL
jgi:hypothetical protein